MKRLGPLLAALGFVLAAVLYIREGIADVLALLTAAGWGLVLAALVHVVPMVLNARAWQMLYTVHLRPRLGLLILAVWIRESVNGLLPVARIGGEIASYRLLTASGMRRTPVAATLVVDMTVSVLTQAAVSVVTVAFLFSAGVSYAFTSELAYGVILLTLLGIVFLWAQRRRAFERMARVIDRLVAGRFRGVIAYSGRMDRTIRVLYQRRNALLGCAVWQAVAWLAGALEIWVALYFLGNGTDPLSALTIELAIQAVSSVAFLVPGALGVQEGAFVVVGRALGLDASTALALAAARRLRDVVVFFPGLLFWQWHEFRGRMRLPSAWMRR
jgi:putative membrane protein